MSEQQEEVLPVIYGGREWQLPELGAKQLRNVRAKIIAITDFLDGTNAETKEGQTAGYRFVHMPDAMYGDMLDVVFWGLTRAEPELTREAFDELKPKDSQLFAAFLIVRRQSGLFVLVPRKAPDAPKDGDAPQEGEEPGEVPAPVA